MASYVTPLRATEFICYVGLPSQADNKLFQVNPTLAAGDVKVSIDGGAFNNLNTLPVVTPASGRAVKVTVSVAEMTADNVQIVFSDAAGAEWCDLLINIQTTTRQINDLMFPNTSGRGVDVTATGAVGIDWANVENQSSVVALSGTQLTALLADSVPTLGDRPTYAQALLIISRFLMEKSLSGTIMTVKKEDGTTASMTFNLNDSTEPTSISRAT